MTYRDLFDMALRERMAAGGAPEELARLVSACERLDSLAREEEFARWLENNPFSCQRCGGSFWASSLTHGEDDYVLCQWCRLTYPAFSAEPMPGWNLTWLR